MAVYNAEQYISSAIESILNQTFSDFEFIIVDDGSKDKSFEIIKKYADIDSRIKIFKNIKNLGLTKSLNKAIKLSTGDFVARQDVDDISLPNRLKIQISFLKENPDYGFCGSNIIVKQNIRRNIKVSEFSDIKRSLFFRNCFWHSTIIIRKKTFEKYGLYDENFLYAQDYELWCRWIYKYNLKAKSLPDKLVLMHVPIKNLTKKDRKKFSTQLKNSIIVKLKYIKYTKFRFQGIISILYNSLVYVCSLNNWTFSLIVNSLLKMKRSLVDFKIA